MHLIIQHLEVKIIIV